MFQFRFFYGAMTTGVIRLEEMKAGGWYYETNFTHSNRRNHRVGTDGTGADTGVRRKTTAFLFAGSFILVSVDRHFGYEH